MVQQASTRSVFPPEIAAYMDVAVYVLDARAPLTTFHVERQLAGERVFVLNKADLADPKETTRWRRCFASLGLEALPLSIRDAEGHRKLRDLLESHRLRKHAARALKVIRETALRVVVLGVPNTGKSTLINRLVGRRKAPTGSRPGLTRGYIWVRILDSVDLLDTPGVLREYARLRKSKPRLLALGLIPEDTRVLEAALDDVLSRLSEHNWRKFQQFYGVDSCVRELSSWEVAELVGRRSRGKTTEASLDDLGYRLLADFRQGRFGQVSLETTAGQGDELAALVARLRLSGERLRKGAAP